MKLKRAIVLGLLMIFCVVGLAMGGQDNRRDRDRGRNDRSVNGTDRGNRSYGRGRRRRHRRRYRRNNNR
jgi:hypothetical protein